MEGKKERDLHAEREKRSLPLNLYRLECRPNRQRGDTRDEGRVEKTSFTDSRTTQSPGGKIGDTGRNSDLTKRGGGTTLTSVLPH